MPNPKQPQPERKPAAASRQSPPSAVPGQSPASAAAQETKRPTDSVPMATGSFTKLPMRFGRYQVEKLLGKGAMGAVYLAKDTQLERLVALKIPKLSGSGAAKLLARLKTEAKAAAQIDHPSVCPVYDTGDIDGTSYIAMQYIEGETLKDHLQKQTHTPAEIVNLILHLAEGLAEAHSKNIYHRDLKPENIKLNRRGIPVIMDFGLAKLAATVSADAGKTQSGTILGSPAYMSPEQASGNVEEIDHRSDIYSLGVIFYEMLTGRWPFTGGSIEVMGRKSILDPPSPLTMKPDLDPQLAAVCHKMIAKEPQNRYQTAQEVIGALRMFDQSRPTPAVKPPTVQETATRRWIWVATASATALVGFAALWMGGVRFFQFETGKSTLEVTERASVVPDDIAAHDDLDSASGNLPDGEPSGRAESENGALAGRSDGNSHPQSPPNTRLPSNQQPASDVQNSEAVGESVVRAEDAADSDSSPAAATQSDAGKAVPEAPVDPVAQAERELEAGFDREIDELETARRADLVANLQREKLAFQRTRAVPWSPRMRKYTEKLIKELKAAGVQRLIACGEFEEERLEPQRYMYAKIKTVKITVQLFSDGTYVRTPKNGDEQRLVWSALYAKNPLDIVFAKNVGKKRLTEHWLFDANGLEFDVSTNFGKNKRLKGRIVPLAQ